MSSGAVTKKAKRAKQVRKRANKSATQALAEAFQQSIPNVSEDDLLAFQFAHFGDDSKPDNWFVDAETAVNFQPTIYEEEDNLGHYEDGVKRTLTDEQIEMFRHSELQEIIREVRLQKEDEEYRGRLSPAPAVTPEAPSAPTEPTIPTASNDREQSPASVASSLENDLMESPAPGSGSKARPEPERKRSQSALSDTSRSTGSMQRRRKEEIPYDQRHKRKWEKYIDNPDHGANTHRRLARELDEQQEESIDMDY